MSYPREFQFRSGIELVHGPKGSPIGLWMKEVPDEMALCALLALSVAPHLGKTAMEAAVDGDFRIVPNRFDQRGGHYVVLGSARAPGETEPLVAIARWKVGQRNLASTSVKWLTEPSCGIKFRCPICGRANFCSEKVIAEDVGAMIQCPSCKNIAHVPGEYKVNSGVSELAIRSCAYGPIAEFKDWFYSHPEFAYGRSQDLASYGLWGYCAGCFHQYASTVLATYPGLSDLKSVFFNAKSEASARDMRALMDGRCSDCKEMHILAVMVPIPPKVQEMIERWRNEGSQSA